MKLLHSLLTITAFTYLASATYQSPYSYNAVNSSLLEQILARGYLKVGTTGDYKPFSYAINNSTIFRSASTTFPNGTITNTTILASSFNTTYIGADITTAQHLSNALALPSPPQYIPTTWSTLLADLAASKFDIAMSGISITFPRARTAFFSTPVMRAGKVACIRCSDAVKFRTLADIDQEGVVVVVNPGGTNEKFDRENLVNAEVRLVSDNNAVYAAVLDGSGDAMISDLVEVELQMRLHEGELCMVTGADGLPFDFSELGYLLPRDVAWKIFLDLFVEIQAGSGSWNQTLTEWMDFGWPSV